MTLIFQDHDLIIKSLISITCEAIYPGSVSASYSIVSPYRFHM